MIKFKVRIIKTGSKFWYRDSEFYRKDGPGIEYFNGCCIWLNDMGEYHRVDGPAVTYSDGTKFWYLDGLKLTRMQVEKERWIRLNEE